MFVDGHVIDLTLTVNKIKESLGRYGIRRFLMPMLNFAVNRQKKIFNFLMKLYETSAVDVY